MDTCHLCQLRYIWTRFIPTVWTTWASEGPLITCSAFLSCGDTSGAGRRLELGQWRSVFGSVKTTRSVGSASLIKCITLTSTLPVTSYLHPPTHPFVCGEICKTHTYIQCVCILMAYYYMSLIMLSAMLDLMPLCERFHSFPEADPSLNHINDAYRTITFTLILL